jgi:hypothetical protein
MYAVFKFKMHPLLKGHFWGKKLAAKCIPLSIALLLLQQGHMFFMENDLFKT